MISFSGERYPSTRRMRRELFLFELEDLKMQIRKKYYKVCPYCNANLDPAEKCDCRQEEE